MARQPRITVLQPDPEVGLGRFDPWLRDAGVRLGVIGLWEKDVPSLASAGDGLLVLGGPMSAQDRAGHHWLDRLADLLADAHSIALPILGICLGHQVLAQSLGGTVRVADPGGGEHGAVGLTWLPEAAADPIFAPIATQSPSLVAMSHHDAVTQLPPGAIELAYSARYRNQTFRLGNAWGVQFHPEKSPGMTSRWETDSDRQYEQMVTELTIYDDQISAVAQQVAVGFAKVVRAEV